MNQFTETFSVFDLAKKVEKVGINLGLNVEIQPVANPRKEAEEHYYNPQHSGLLELGLKPNYLSEDFLEQMMRFVLKHRSQIKLNQIYRQVNWA